MATSTRFGIVELAAVSALLLASITPTATRAVEPAVTVLGATDDERALVEWAVGLFDSAGLALPPATVVFYAGDRAWRHCNGALGIYRPDTRTIEMCNSTRPWAERRHWMLHELAHAHGDAALSAQDVSAINRRHGLTNWNDHSEPRYQRGTERFADIVAWGLNPQPPSRYWMQELPCDWLANEFSTLTGVEVAHPACVGRVTRAGSPQ